MHIHFIGIGGSIMHNLAITLSIGGHSVTGSDNEIYDPARTRLQKYGLLPLDMGRDKKRITNDIDIVILGMTAHTDNPELEEARRLNITIMTYPEYITQQSIQKGQKRVVIAGSHGKTTTTAMIVHILKTNNIDVDYLIGSQLPGYETMVHLSDAPVMIIEGDEYPESRETMVSKCHVYKHDIGVLNGIDRDHVNIFPSYESYVDAFRIFVGLTPADGQLLYTQDDPAVCTLMQEFADAPFEKKGYMTHPYTKEGGLWHLLRGEKRTALQVFGKHNMSNISAAIQTCQTLGLEDTAIYDGLSTFSGTTKRLNKIYENTDRNIVAYIDFAHAPSKVRATIDAVREQHPDHTLVSCFELHSYSSTDASFLEHYDETMSQSDIACIYASAHAFEVKQKQSLSHAQIKQGFGSEEIMFATSPEMLNESIGPYIQDNTVLLMMSSGTFDGWGFDPIQKGLEA